MLQKEVNKSNLILRIFASSTSGVCTTREVLDFMVLFVSSINVSDVTRVLIRMSKDGIIQEFGISYSHNPTEPTHGVMEKRWKLTRLGFKHPVVIDRKYS